MLKCELSLIEVKIDELGKNLELFTLSSKSFDMIFGDQWDIYSKVGIGYKLNRRRQLAYH